MEVYRSWLFAPGTEKRKMEKALASAADQVVFDLEDAVPPEQKDAALSLILETAPTAARPFYVRINRLDDDRCHKDLLALVAAGSMIKGFIIPKLESASDCAVINWLIDALEKEQRLPEKGLDLMPVIETARGF